MKWKLTSIPESKVDELSINLYAGREVVEHLPSNDSNDKSKNFDQEEGGGWGRTVGT